MNLLFLSGRLTWWRLDAEHRPGSLLAPAASDEGQSGRKQRRGQKDAEKGQIGSAVSARAGRLGGAERMGGGGGGSLDPHRGAARRTTLRRTGRAAVLRGVHDVPARRCVSGHLNVRSERAANRIDVRGVELLTSTTVP